MTEDGECSSSRDECTRSGDEGSSTTEPRLSGCEGSESAASGALLDLTLVRERKYHSLVVHLKRNDLKHGKGGKSGPRTNLVSSSGVDALTLDSSFIFIFVYRSTTCFLLVSQPLQLSTPPHGVFTRRIPPAPIAAAPVTGCPYVTIVDDASRPLALAKRRGHDWPPSSRAAAVHRCGAAVCKD